MYMPWDCIIGVGNNSDDSTKMCSGSVVDDIETGCEIDEDDDLVSILSQ